MIRRDRVGQLTELLMEVDDSTISAVIDGAIEQGEIGEIICAFGSKEAMLHGTTLIGDC